MRQFHGEHTRQLKLSCLNFQWNTSSWCKLFKKKLHTRAWLFEAVTASELTLLTTFSHFCSTFWFDYSLLNNNKALVEQTSEACLANRMYGQATVVQRVDSVIHPLNIWTTAPRMEVDSNLKSRANICKFFFCDSIVFWTFT